MLEGNENDIIRAVLDGDADAFGALVDATQTRVYNLALKMTRNEQDAMDISQDAYMKAYSNLSALADGAKFTPWILRITYNLAIDHIRRASKVNIISLTPSGDDETIAYDIPDSSKLPETELESRELREEIQDCISRLPDDYRHVLTLRAQADMSYEDIAETLKIKVGTVRSRLSRARQRIMMCLTKKGTFSDDVRLNSRKEASEDD